jgi:hypothetical protein
MLNRVKETGLYDEVDEVRIFLYGAAVNTSFVSNHYPKKYGEKVKICFISEDMSLREINTLDVLKDDASKELFNVLYIHAKGATSWNFEPETIQPMSSWLEYMMYFNINKWKNCIEFLNEGFDTVGVDLKNKNPNGEHGVHYSGNIWWSSSKHINTLKVPSDLNLYGTRLDAENWICSNNSNSISLWNTEEINLYTEVYDKNNYIDKEFKINSYVIKKGNII